MEIKEYVLQEKERIKAEVASMSEAPVLSIITVGHNPASESYVRGKKKDSAEVGITAIQTQFEEDVTEEEVLSLIRKQNTSTPFYKGKIYVNLIICMAVHSETD